MSSVRLRGFLGSRVLLLSPKLLETTTAVSRLLLKRLWLAADGDVQYNGLEEQHDTA
jgi:hypothetical protein